MRTFLRSFIEYSQFKYYFSPYFASAGFKEEMGAQKARPAAKKAPGVRHRRITKFFMQDTVQSLKRGCTVFCFMQKI